MKLAHVTATFPPYFAGTGNVAFHNARRMAELGHDVTVYTATASGAPREEHDGFRVRRLRPLLRLGNAPLLPGLALMGHHDLVHLHYPFIFGAETVLLLSRLKGRPYVVTYHNDLVASGFKGLLFTLYERVWAGRILRGARTIIVPTLEAALASPVLGPIVRADPSRVEELPNGVDTTLFHPAVDGRRVRGELGGENTKVVLFVGSMDSAHHPKGGVPVLLEAAARLGDADLRLVLVGGGDRVAEYRRQAAELGIEGRSRFVGRVPHDQLGEYYAAADLVVQPSQDREMFGMAAVEAMACGKAVIASDLPGARSVVLTSGGGRLARPGDPADLSAMMASLLADPDTRQRLGLLGRASVASRYGWNGIGQALDRICREALVPRSTTPAGRSPGSS